MEFLILFAIVSSVSVVLLRRTLFRNILQSTSNPDPNLIDLLSSRQEVAWYYEGYRTDIARGLYKITDRVPNGNRYLHRGVLVLKIDLASCVALTLVDCLNRPSCEHTWHHSPGRNPAHIAPGRTMKAVGMTSFEWPAAYMTAEGIEWVHWWGTMISGMIAPKCAFCNKVVIGAIYYNGPNIMHAEQYAHGNCLIPKEGSTQDIKEEIV